MTEITLPAITDAHVHLRQGIRTYGYAADSARVCGRVIAMPNTEPPIATADDVKRYYELYQSALSQRGMCLAEMTAKLLPTTTPDDVAACKRAGAVGFKLYPSGVTTNSNDGIPADWLKYPDGNKSFRDVLAAIRDNDLVLLCHGEMPGAFCLDREREFLPFAQWVLREYRGIRLTLEHITTVDAVRFVCQQYIARHRILGTITAHHLFLTLDDVIGDKLRPDNFCKPIAKRSSDRGALLDAAMLGDACFAFGSDSAPHTPEAKYGSHGCAGVYSAPVMLECLAEVFACWGGPETAQLFAQFTSGAANAFYGFPPPERKLTLVKDAWRVPADYDGVVPFRAGEEIGWRLI